MAKKKEQTLKDLSAEELHAKLRDLDRELFELRNELAMQKKLEKPHLIKEKRKIKARIYTFLTQKKTQEVV